MQTASTTTASSVAAANDLPDFWSGTVAKRQVTAVHISASPLPVHHIIINPKGVGAAVCYQCYDGEFGKNRWLISYLSSDGARWSKTDIQGGFDETKPTLAAIRIGPATREHWVLVKHNKGIQTVKTQLHYRTGLSGLQKHLTLTGVVGGAFSGDGKSLAVIAADGLVSFGGLNEGIFDGSMAETSPANLLTTVRAVRLITPNGGEVHTASLALDSSGTNIFLVAHCRTREKDGTTLEQRPRFWLRERFQRLELWKYNAGRQETWATNVTCYEQPLGAGKVVPSTPSPKKIGGKLKAALASPASKDGLSAIFSGIRPEYALLNEQHTASIPVAPKPLVEEPEMSESLTNSPQATQAPETLSGGSEEENAPRMPASHRSAISGVIVLDATTILDWTSTGVRIVALPSNEIESKPAETLEAQVLLDWRPPDGQRVVGVQDDVLKGRLYIYMA